MVVMFNPMRLASGSTSLVFGVIGMHTARGQADLVNKICGSLRKGRSWDVVSAELDSVELTNSVGEQVLLEFKEPVDAKRALSFFHWSSQRAKNFEPDVRLYCIMIQTLVRAKLLIDASVLLEKAIRVGHSELVIVDCLLDLHSKVQSSPFLFDFLVQMYAKLRMPRVAFAVCKNLQEHGFFPSLNVLNKLIHIAQRIGDNKLVWNVYEFMLVHRTYPNEITTQILISAMCKEGILLKFIDLLGNIHRKKCTAVVVVNTCLVFRMIEENRTNEGILLLKRMLQKNVMLADVAYSIIIYAHCRSGDLDAVRESYEDMLRNGYCSNAFLYTLFIDIQCKENIEEACRLMQEMKDEGLKPYKHTYDTLIEGCCLVGELHLGLMWYEEMLSAGLIPDVLVCNILLSKLCENRNVKRANDILTVLLDKGFCPTEATYSCIIDGYGKEGNIREVLKLYYEMEHGGPSPGLTTYFSVIKSLCLSGKLGEADKYLSIMADRNLVPSSSLYNILIQRHCEEGNVERAFRLYDEMLSNGIKSDSHTCAILKVSSNTLNIAQQDTTGGME